MVNYQTAVVAKLEQHASILVIRGIKRIPLFLQFHVNHRQTGAQTHILYVTVSYNSYFFNMYQQLVEP